MTNSFCKEWEYFFWNILFFLSLSKIDIITKCYTFLQNFKNQVQKNSVTHYEQLCTTKPRRVFDEKSSFEKLFS